MIVTLQSSTNFKNASESSVLFGSRLKHAERIFRVRDEF